MVRRARPRRGILLLIVLSLLVLFMLIGITFIVVASRHADSAKAYTRHEQKGDAPAQELDAAMYLLLRGTQNTGDLLNRHSLLEDLYGVDGLRAAVQTIVPLQSAMPAPSPELYQITALVPPNQRRSLGYFSGSVLTMLDGAAKGHSTRILRYTPGPTATDLDVFVIESFADIQGPVLPEDRFLVNGRPFNGTGDGYRPVTGRLDWNKTYNTASGGPSPIEVALLPNLRHPYRLHPAYVGDRLADPDGPPRYGAPTFEKNAADESWDAVDYQNYFLARVPAGFSPGGVFDSSNPLLPSFHRPFLINYWMQRWATNVTTPWQSPELNDFRRLIVSRPLPQDHPYFSGSNPAFDPFLDTNADGIPNWLDVNDGDGNGLSDSPLVQGPWDIDNDGDGVADSVWVDVGLPIKTSPDGRLYKPLVAVLCVDLDGRLNVNAHDVYPTAAMRQLFEVAGYDGLRPVVTDPNGYAAGSSGPGTVLFADLVQGSGFGPAEIRLDRVLDRTVAENLLRNRLQFTGSLDPNPTPGWLGDYLTSRVDAANYLDQSGIPYSFNGQHTLSAPNGNGSLYQSPSDLRGLGKVYLDHAGQPIYAQMGLPGETVDDPYEKNLNEPQASDSLFTNEELEQILRYHDMDSMSMSSRLRDLLLLSTDNAAQPGNLRRFTTRSFDVPIANVQAPKDTIRDNIAHAGLELVGTRLATANVTLSDLLKERLETGAFESALKSSNPSAYAIQLERQLRLMLGPDLLGGLRWDINRPFGNGRDDNNNNVVDEPLETAQQPMWNDIPSGPFNSLAKFAVEDPNYISNLPNYQPNDDNPLFSRQVYARQLYCLMMLLVDTENFEVDSQSVTDAIELKKLTARRIAQWAVNVVDFRDPDAIMTPFEYDWNPFDADGWSVDDNFADNTENAEDRCIVWGCEAPELLITETLAFHDRRIKDTDFDDESDLGAGGAGEESKERFPAENRDGDPMNDVQPDSDLDQYRMPQGSLFVELYCIGRRWQNSTIAPAELYSTHPMTQHPALDLGRIAGTGANASPVWRVAVAEPQVDNEETMALLQPALLQDENLYEPNDNGLLARLTRDSDGLPDNSISTRVDRYIVFTNSPPASISGAYYYNRGDRPLLEPGQYAVVGPRRVTSVGSLDNVPDNQPSQMSRQQILIDPTMRRFDQPLTSLPANGVRSLRLGLPAGQDLPLARHFDSNIVDIKPTLGIVVAASPPTTWPANLQTQYRNIGIGINISEPVPTNAYYRAPQWGPAGEPHTYYGDPQTKLPLVPDTPFDEDQNANGPLADSPQFVMTGTHPQFRVLLLQRLADPTRPFDPRTNPYITVDSQSVDLTVFNGEEVSDKDPPGWENYRQTEDVAYDPFDDPNDPNNPPEHFASRQRGKLQPIPATELVTVGPVIWNPISSPPQRTQENPTVTDTVVKYELRHTLGYLNTLADPAIPGEIYGPRLRSPALYVGDPANSNPQVANPFPWYTWNNRPFISPYELLLVPTAAPWRMMYEFRGVHAMDEREDEFELGGYPHLLNFFHSPSNGGTPPSNLSRIFDLLGVKSPFTGTEKTLHPIAFSGLVPGAVPDDLLALNVPNNRISEFRDPGKVNVNTMVDSTVWAAIDPLSTTTWPDLQLSLRGGTNHAQIPAFYGNPVRSAASADLMPLASLHQTPADATLLRKAPNGDNLLFDFPFGQPYDNPDRNAYFRFHKVQRLHNLLTTHSNVFAVWITVGYFEVFPWNPIDPSVHNLPPVIDDAHPDGYQLGPEMGSETGRIERHRGFYLIDRSIPVGFEPGENHNVDDAVILRRMIE